MPARTLGTQGLWLNSYVDVPCSVFLPSRAAPTTRMSTVTVLEQTSNGVSYQHGYNDFSQTYDLMVSGYQDYGVILLESVAIALASIPPEVTPYNVDAVEFNFLLTETNNYASEYTGLVDISTYEMPRSQSTESQWDQWFYDARGLWGNVYYVGNFQPRAYTIDLGPDAITDMQGRVDAPGWFGIGMAGDGWDLAGSPGQLVYNRSAGGGDAIPGRRPFFRIYYNAPPAAFQLIAPASGTQTTNDRPAFQWHLARDPDRGDVVTYRLQYDVTPAFTSPVSIDGIVDTVFTPSVPLAPGNTYYWRVRAIDNRQNVRWSTDVRTVTINSLSAAGDLPRSALRPLGAPFPNPTSGSLSASVNVSGPATIDIVDIAGRLLSRHPADASSGRFSWDGMDDSGLPAPSGQYYLVLRTPSFRDVRPFRVVR